MPERENFEAKKEYFEQRLWAKAEELSILRVSLQAELDKLYDRIQKKDVDAIGLHAEQLLRQMQGRYREIEEEIAEVKDQEKNLQAAIEAERLRLQQLAPAENPEFVIVLETIGTVANFAKAVEKVPGLEWLLESGL